MKKNKMKEDKHLTKMVENWKKKRSCVGVCYLVKIKEMEMKKNQPSTTTSTTFSPELPKRLMDAFQNKMKKRLEHNE